MESYSEGGKDPCTDSLFLDSGKNTLVINKI